ncbi:hypothetical protein FACS1894205_5400 [Alphaproteobacteria bacterium]|nr:hypothetical protein FACS1894205_5400 [Alphaproteobacteria bacterium]
MRKFILLFPLFIICTALVAPFFISTQTIAETHYARTCLDVLAKRLTARPDAIEIRSLTVSSKGAVEAERLKSHILAEFARLNQAPDEALVAASIASKVSAYETLIIHKTSEQERNTASCVVWQEEGPVGFFQSFTLNDRLWDNRSEDWMDVAPNPLRLDIRDVSYRDKFDATLFSLAGRSNSR